MSDHVWLFPGQGSQSVGMGAALARREPAARAVFAEADDALGFPLSRIIFEGPAEDLERTANQQPAILATSVAYLRVLEARGELPPPRFVAGHSLGEYTALVAAGSLGLADAVRLVRRRGDLMREHGSGGMAAIIGADIDAVRALAVAAGASVANLNAPGQVVISGTDAAIERAVALGPDHGARRVVRLPVSGAFHSPMMAPVVDGLRPTIEATEIRPARVRLVSNVTVALVQEPDEIRRELVGQICAPVRWVEVVERLGREGVRSATEIGPGKVLAGLVSRITKDIDVRPGEALANDSRADAESR